MCPARGHYWSLRPNGDYTARRHRRPPVHSAIVCRATPAVPVVSTMQQPTSRDDAPRRPCAKCVGSSATVPRALAIARPTTATHESPATGDALSEHARSDETGAPSVAVVCHHRATRCSPTVVCHSPVRLSFNSQQLICYPYPTGGSYYIVGISVSVTQCIHFMSQSHARTRTHAAYNRLTYLATFATA
jgi:hypothetical protein